MSRSATAIVLTRLAGTRTVVGLEKLNERKVEPESIFLGQLVERVLIF